MPFWKCYYHIVWATKHRTPIIVPLYEPVLFGAIQQKSAEFKCDLIAINGTEDHLHVAIAIPPSIAPAQVIGSIKGISANAINKTFETADFYWQESYGIMTLGEKALPMVCAYIENQKSHHQQGTTNAYLEAIE